MICVVAVHIP